MKKIAFVLSMAAAGCGNVEAENQRTLTIGNLPWHEAPVLEARKSRDIESICIENDVDEIQAIAGDSVRLTIDDSSEGCLPASAIENIIPQSEISKVVCKVEGSFHQLEYLEILGYKTEELLGFSLTGEEDTASQLTVWWEAEGNMQDMVDPEIIATKEDPKLGTLNTYRYEFPLRSSLTPFIFQTPDNLYAGNFVVTNYWLNDETVFYMSFDTCKME